MVLNLILKVVLRVLLLKWGEIQELAPAPYS